MKISTLCAAYYEATGKASDLIRQLDFAGIAVVWMFKGEADPAIHFPNRLLWVLGCFAVSLACDLCQYVYKSAMLGLMNHHFWNNHHDDEQDVRFSSRWNWPGIALFWSKIAAVIAGYAMLLNFIQSRLS